ncbi:threonine synthase [bacterium]|nr:threonine synthase [bacterium]
MIKPLTYISTRGDAEPVGFDDVLLAGMAPDGGLYVPSKWPHITLPQWTKLSQAPYQTLATAMLTPFMQGSSLLPQLDEIVEEAYRGFHHAAIAPLVQLSADEWVLELFHGPTLAFKDVALQFLGQCLRRMLETRQQQVTVIGATSGDTGSAAIEACRGNPNIRCVILHPHGKISHVQRLQMTTVPDDNIHNIAIDGSFDDCQFLVKQLFADAEFRQKLRLTAVNSINWCRIMAQSVYYAYAALRLGGPWQSVNMVVPTGNFGNIFAGHVARHMGLPLGRLVVATNRNDILSRLWNEGDYHTRSVEHSLAPSMDIQVASNLERLLLEADHGPAPLTKQMRALREEGGFQLKGAPLSYLRKRMAAGSAGDEDIAATIQQVHQQTGMVVDPHTAAGIHVGRQMKLQGPTVYLATAHPAKFPDAVHKAIGLNPALPPHLSDLTTRKERFDVMPNDIAKLRGYLQKSA